MVLLALPISKFVPNGCIFAFPIRNTRFARNRLTRLYLDNAAAFVRKEA